MAGCLPNRRNSLNPDAARSFGVLEFPIHPNSDRSVRWIDKCDFQKLDTLSTFWTSLGDRWAAQIPGWKRSYGSCVKTVRHNPAGPRCLGNRGGASQLWHAICFSPTFVLAARTDGQRNASQREAACASESAGCRVVGYTRRSGCLRWIVAVRLGHASPVELWGSSD